MQLTNAQKALALQELLEMLAAHPEGLSTHQLQVTKSFHNRRELSAKQVEQLLSRVSGVEMQLKGVSVVSLSKLLGHSSIKITEDTYSRWIAERQSALDSEVRTTWR